MRPLYARPQEARRRLGIPWEVLERDYLLAWVLAGVSQVPKLHETLAFKGGTALKKCYFGDYRFSEDLDFSGLDDVPKDEAIERLVREACEAAVRLLGEYAPWRWPASDTPKESRIREVRRLSLYEPGPMA